MKRLFLLLAGAILAFAPPAHAQIVRDTVNGWVPHIPFSVDSIHSELTTDALRGTAQRFYMRTQIMTDPVYWEKNFGVRQMPLGILYNVVSRGIGPRSPEVFPEFYFEVYVGYPDSTYAYLYRNFCVDNRKPWTNSNGGWNTDNLPQKPFDKILFKLYVTKGVSDTTWCAVHVDNLRLIYGKPSNPVPDSVVVLDSFGPDPPVKAIFSKNIDSTGMLGSSFVGRETRVGIAPELIITNTGDDTLRMNVRTKGVHFSLAPLMKSIAPGAEWHWSDSLAFIPKAYGELSDDALVFEHNGDTSPDTVVLRGYGLSYHPIYGRRKVTLGAVAPGSVASDTFSIRNDGNVFLRLTAASSSPFFSAAPETVRVKPLASYPDSFSVIAVKFSAGSELGLRKGFILMRSIPDPRDPSPPFIDTIEVAADVTTDVESETDGLPKAFALSQNYPNPFNPSTAIRYDLPRAAHVALSVYDLLGKEVWKEEGIRPAGAHTARFDGTGLSSGIYFYRFAAEEWVSVKRMLLLK